MEPAEASPIAASLPARCWKSCSWPTPTEARNAANDELVEVTGRGVRGLFGVVCTSFFVRRRSGLAGL
jgi:hypothetical protein